MKDGAITFTLMGAFALLVTLHVVISFRLARKHRYAESLGGFVAAPLAPFFALRAGMTALAATWVLSAVVYIGAFMAASR